MNLVNELQSCAIRDDVLTVLRNARRLASKLGVNDIDEWLMEEQNGYANRKNLPKYRMLKGTVAFNTNGPIPLGLNISGDGIMDYPGGGITINAPVLQSMGNIIALIERSKRDDQGIFMQIDNSLLKELRYTLHADLADQVAFLLRLNEAQVRAIPEAVKDKILEWACELERRGVHGENQSFNDNEQYLAQSINMYASGDIHNIAANSAPVAVSGRDAFQTSGEINMVEVALKDEQSFGAKAVDWVKGKLGL